jgi:hypothetical protein
MSKIKRIFAIFLFLLKNIKVGEQHLLLTDFNIFDFKCTLLLKMGPNYDLKNSQKKTQGLDLFYTHQVGAGAKLIYP